MKEHGETAGDDQKTEPQVKCRLTATTYGYLRCKRFIVEKTNAESRFVTLPMVQFLDDMESEKPIRFTSKQLRFATNNFKTKLGLCGFGTVYKGVIGNNQVAVKVLNGISKERVEEQFMAEVSTMERTHHFNQKELCQYTKNTYYGPAASCVVIVCLSDNPEEEMASDWRQKAIKGVKILRNLRNLEKMNEKEVNKILI
ncbi:hypothetical protein E3N88_35991 [Mikania micrantha]|uniref:Serine-threonine/tyrosine-protein kinase catalytic domain-containing protein n=1 Tax=Mikania micrantha TaxID=192012 RepID=A0A5N6M309_9ASTR|nr:hypothetical protein E3N88_35991 [Mikania micrantha]